MANRQPMPTNTPSVGQLKRAVEIAEKIETLQTELSSIFGSSSAASLKTQPAKPSQKTGKRTMSPEARARISAATRARWARVKGTANPTALKAAPAAAKPVAAKKKKGGLTDEGRARLAAMMKARWAAKRKGAGTPAKAAAGAPAAKKVRRTISPEARARMIAGAKRRWARKK